MVASEIAALFVAARVAMRRRVIFIYLIISLVWPGTENCFCGFNFMCCWQFALLRSPCARRWPDFSVISLMDVLLGCWCIFHLRCCGSIVLRCCFRILQYRKIMLSLLGRDLLWLKWAAAAAVTLFLNWKLRSTRLTTISAHANLLTN